MIQDGTSGRLPANIGRFARLLRRAGIAIGPGDVLVAAAAVAAVDMASRIQVHAALKATLVKRREHLPLFEQAFDVFWRDPQLRERLLSLLLPQVESERTPDGRKLARRLADAFAGDAPPPPPPPEEKLREETRIDASLTWDATERLKTRDFEQMSADEAAEARRAIRLLRARLPERPVRRLKAASAGPMRVPPDQSFTLRPIAVSASSGSRRASSRVTSLNLVPNRKTLTRWPASCIIACSRCSIIRA